MSVDMVPKKLAKLSLSQGKRQLFDIYLFIVFFIYVNIFPSSFIGALTIIGCGSMCLIASYFVICINFKVFTKLHCIKKVVWNTWD